MQIIHILALNIINKYSLSILYLDGVENLQK